MIASCRVCQGWCCSSSAWRDRCALVTAVHRLPATALPLSATAQLAEGEPPRVNVASFRLLFMIVRDDPPQVG